MELSSTTTFHGGSEEMDAQQIRFSSTTDINTSDFPPHEVLTINKRRACSNDFPNQFLLGISTTPVWAPVSTSSGFGGSNTMAAMTASFNSVNTSPPEKPLSRSLESLAIIGGPCTSDSIFQMMTKMELTGEPARDDSRVNYSFDYDSGVGNRSVDSTATTGNNSFSSAAESFMSNHTSHQQFDDVDPLVLRPSVDEQQQFNSAYNDIIESLQQCQLVGIQAQNDFEMSEY